MDISTRDLLTGLGVLMSVGGSYVLLDRRVTRIEAKAEDIPGRLDALEEAKTEEAVAAALVKQGLDALGVRVAAVEDELKTLPDKVVAAMKAAAPNDRRGA